MKYFIINYKNEFSCKMLIALTIFLAILPKTLLANYIPASGSQYPHVAPSPSVSSGGRTGLVQEKECFVARICEYKFRENFSCKVSEYVISNGVDRILPKWLWFDERNQTLKGIPSPTDEGLSEILIAGLNRHQTGPIDYICGLLTVKINVLNVKYVPLFTQNIPTSPVISGKFLKPAWQGFTCQFNEPIVLASLVLAGNFHKMGGKEKIIVLDKLLQNYHISIYEVFILPNNEDSLSSLLQTSHVLASGPGANRSASGLSTTITWHVRCGVIHLDDSLFPALEKLSKQLTIINNVGYAPIGWHVVTGFQKHHVRRRRNVVGTTTPAYSTVPISRATVITTKIKITKTTYATATETFTWTRPLPTFSSPYTVNMTSLYNQSLTTSSGFNNTITPSSQTISPSKHERSEISQYKSVISTLPLMSSSGSMSSPSRISTLDIKNITSTKILISPLSPSGQILKTSKSGTVFSTLPVISQSKNKSETLQMSSSNSIITSLQTYPTSRVTGLDSLSFTSQLPSSKRGTLLQPSSTASTTQSSTYVLVPLSRNITSSLPSAVQTVINNTSISPTISSQVLISIFTSEQYLTSTSKFSSIWSTRTKATQPNNFTTNLLQPSHSGLTDSMNHSRSTTYSPVSHVTTCRIKSETKSTNVNQYESSIAHTRSMLSIITTPSTNNPSYVPYTSSSRSSPRTSCTRSCTVSTFSKNINSTPSSGEQQDTTTLYQASIITTSETTTNSSRITGTLVPNTRSATTQTSKYIDKTIDSSVSTSEIISKSLQSSDYITLKALTTISAIYSSSLSSGSGKTMSLSSTGAMTSQRISEDRIRSTFTSTLVKTTLTGKTLNITTSQTSSEYKSSLSPISSTLTEQLRSTYSSLIRATPTSTYTFSLQTKTIGSGLLVTNIVTNHSVSSLFTLHISGAFSSYIIRSDMGDSSMTGSIDQSAFQTRSSSTLSSHNVSLSSFVTLSNQNFERSTLTVLKTTSSPVVPSFYQTPTTHFVNLTPSLVLSSYYTLTSSPISINILSSSATSEPSVIDSTPLSHQMSSLYTTSPSSTLAIVTPSSYLLSSHTATNLTSIVDVFASSSVYASYHTPSLAATTSFPSLSYNTGTSPSFGITTTIPLSLFISYTHTSPLSFSTISLSSSYHSSTLPSSVVTISALSDIFTTSTFWTSVIASHTTNKSTVGTITSSSYFPSSYTKASSTSLLVSPSMYVSYRILTLASFAVTSSPVSFSSGNAATSPPSVITTSSSSNLVSFYHTSISPPFVFSTPSYLLSHHERTSLLTFVNTITSSYHTPSTLVRSTDDTPSYFAAITSPVYLSSYHTHTSPLGFGTVTSSSHVKSFPYTKTSLRTSIVIPFLNSKTVRTSVSSSYLPITFSPLYLSSYHTSLSSVSMTRSSYLLSSYYTQALSSAPTINFSSSYHTPTSPSSPGNMTSLPYHSLTLPSSASTITSYNTVFSSFFPTTDTLKSSPSNLPSSSTTLPPTSHKTFSLSFLSSSIVSSKPSVSSDPLTGLSMSYTLTKSSLKTWLVRPSNTWQNSRTTTVVFTLTSVRIPVITSRAGVNPTSTLSRSRSSSTVVTRPTIPLRESPKIYNNFDLLRVTVGKVFSVQIPVDTFHDREDGNTRNLRLECVTSAHARLPSNSWLQFNSTTQTLYGIILKSQLGTISSEYLLSASDHDGNTVYDAFTVIIEESSKILAAMFSVELTGINLEMFNRDINNILSIVQTIAGYYGDTDESMIQVLSLMEGSVIFTWSNTSLQTCDKYLIDDVASKIITREANVQQDFYNALSPRFIANDVFVNYTEPCVVFSTENPSASESSSDHKALSLLKYVLPSLAVAVVFVVIVVAFLIVKRRSGVKILKEDKKTFKRRKPIILDDEQEMSTLCGKPIELPEDSLSPIRFPRESSLGTPDYDEDDIPEFMPSPILPAPSYQRLPPRYSGEHNRYNTPPPPYKLPPSY